MPTTAPSTSTAARRDAQQAARRVHQVAAPAQQRPHRPCLFPVEYRDAAGKIRRRYPRGGVTTPYEAFKALDDANTHLKLGLTFARLGAIAYAESDLAAARLLNDARRELFRTVFGDPLAA